MVYLYLPNHYAFKAGARAYHAGKLSGANPYKQGTLLYKLWIRGFMSAMSDETLKGKP